MNIVLVGPCRLAFLGLEGSRDAPPQMFSKVLVVKLALVRVLKWSTCERPTCRMGMALVLPLSLSSTLQIMKGCIGAGGSKHRNTR